MKNPVKPMFCGVLNVFECNNVTTMGFEPTRPCEHQPLKLASLPISPRGLKSKKVEHNARLLVTRLGLEPRTPSLKVMCSTN